jgi:polysaccharide deacetylase family protein (PEP-CTERM system associated)
MYIKNILETDIVNILTFDIEDWFHILDLPNDKDISKWSEYESRVEQNTFKILTILQRYNVKATFFILGWIAERYPDLIKEIQNQGHEIGCHGYGHQLLNTLSKQEFREDLLKSQDIIGSITGKQPLSYRGPGFSITPENKWVLEIIAECGFKYDSSIYPGQHGHGGYPLFTSKPVIIRFNKSNRELFEFPVSVGKVFKKKMCFSGGGYLRLLPYRIIKKKFHEFNAREQPVMVYLHPREIDLTSPRLTMPIKRRFKCYVNIKSAEKKLIRLLEEFNFTTLHDYFGNCFDHRTHQVIL